jgi:hypothetical protein
VLILTGHGKIVIDMLDSQPKLPILINSGMTGYTVPDTVPAVRELRPGVWELRD